MTCINCFAEMNLVFKYYRNAQEPYEEQYKCSECGNVYDYNEAYGECWSILPEEDKIEAMEEDSDENI